MKLHLMGQKKEGPLTIQGTILTKRRIKSVLCISKYGLPAKG